MCEESHRTKSPNEEVPVYRVVRTGTVDLVPKLAVGAICPFDLLAAEARKAGYEDMPDDASLHVPGTLRLVTLTLGRQGPYHDRVAGWERVRGACVPANLSVERTARPTAP
jgi:hypothetical protein